MDYVNLLSKLPLSKITKGGIAGLISTALIFCLNQFTDIDVNAELSSAITLVVTTGVAYVVKLKPEELKIEP